MYFESKSLIKYNQLQTYSIWNRHLLFSLNFYNIILKWSLTSFETVARAFHIKCFWLTKSMQFLLFSQKKGPRGIPGLAGVDGPRGFPGLEGGKGEKGMKYKFLFIIFIKWLWLNLPTILIFKVLLEFWIFTWTLA